MQQGHGFPRRQQEPLPINPIVRSQSWNRITVTAGPAANCDLISTNVGYCDAEGPLAAKHRGGQLPPLRHNDRRPPIWSPSKSIDVKDAHRPSPGRGHIGSHWAVRSLRPGSPVPNLEWTAIADLYLQAGEAAGIAFQWAAMPIPSLYVVEVAEGSVAARHGGIFPGMMLLEISRHRVIGMSQDKIMQSVQIAALQPRVLTLAQRSWSSTSGYHSCETVALPGDSTFSSLPKQLVPVPGERLQLASHSTSCPSRSSLPSSKGSETSPGSTSGVVGTTAVYVKPSTLKARISSVPRNQDPFEQILELRFVGSRGDLSLFDRDHILGMKERDIEFVPSRSSSIIHHTNSRRSLGEMTLDWRNDPFSTPARRRRLIDDVCRAVVLSYAHAAVSRLLEFRKQEALAARIQAMVRMRFARSRFKVELAARREKASRTLQFTWLAYAARRQTWILREERDATRRADEIARMKRLVREQEERLLCLEERLSIAREAAEQEKQRREQQASAILLQRSERARQAHRRFIETKRIRDQQRAALVSKAADTIQVATRCWQRRREIAARISRDRMIAEAVSLLQLTWREKFVLGRRNYQTNNHHDTSNSTSICEDQGELGAISGDIKNTSINAEIPPPAAPIIDPVVKRQESGVDAGNVSGCLTARSTAASLQGMMIVRVKIGSDERSLVTPIVLRESDQKTVEAPAGTGRWTYTDTSNNHGRQLSLKTSASGGSVHITGEPDVVEDHVTGGIHPFVEHSHKPTAGWTKQEAKTVKAEASTLNAAYPEVHHAAAQVDTDKSHHRKITLKGKAATFTSSGGLNHMTPTTARSYDQFTSRRAEFAAENHQEEHYFMEDSQVYLGCALCGVKYLVESVDPRLPESGQGQPTPEVLYLCTTCGGTLKLGEDGRWRRRNRPSSAPAAGRRIPSHDVTSRHCMQEYQDWNPRKGAHSSEITSKQELRGSDGERREPKTRLKYTLSARIIQHAYRDYRHRQYLRDWAFSLLRRWFLGHMEARRQLKRRIFFHQAVVAIQSFARVASARTHCSILRAERRRFWVDRASALWDAHDAINAATLPASEELLQGLDAPPSPPLQESESCNRQYAPGSEPCRIGYGREMAEALSPTIVGPPPPGCPAPHEVDWGKWGVKLKLMFDPAPGLTLS